MFWLHVILLIVGGGLAMASFIIAKKPEAKDVFNKIMPYQAAIGVTMMVIGLINILQGNLMGGFRMLDLSVLLGLTILSTIFCEIVVGFLLGFGLIAKWIPGESEAEQKVVEVQQKLIKFQTPFGAIAIATAVLWLLYRFGIL